MPSPARRRFATSTPHASQAHQLPTLSTTLARQSLFLGITPPATTPLPPLRPLPPAASARSRAVFLHGSALPSLVELPSEARFIRRTTSPLAKPLLPPLAVVINRFFRKAPRSRPPPSLSEVRHRTTTRATRARCAIMIGRSSRSSPGGRARSWVRTRRSRRRREMRAGFESWRRRRGTRYALIAVRVVSQVSCLLLFWVSLEKRADGCYPPAWQILDGRLGLSESRYACGLPSNLPSSECQLTRLSLH